MTKDESLALTAEIAGRICSGSLTVEYSDDEAEQARRAAPTERLRRLRAAGLLESRAARRRGRNGSATM